MEAKGKPNFFKNFFIRRALRIFPLYYLFLILVFLLVPLLKENILGDFSFYQSNQIYFWLYLQNWLFSYKGFPENFSLHHLWSLGVEEQFYLFWPFVIYFVKNNNKLIITSVFLICISIIFRHFGDLLGFVFPYSYVHIFSRMDALIIGGLIAILIRDHPAVLKKYVLYLLGISILAVLIQVGIVKTLFFWFFTNVYSFIGLIFASFLAITCLDFKWSPFLRTVLNTNFLKYFGKYSYGLYIYHYPLYFISLKYLVPYLNSHGISIFASNIINGIICILFTCVISYFSFEYFESKFLLLKDRWTNK
jgi:peptidoglycan/LPS O-acetylase OafA/YrhL